MTSSLPPHHATLMHNGRSHTANTSNDTEDRSSQQSLPPRGEPQPWQPFAAEYTQHTHHHRLASLPPQTPQRLPDTHNLPLNLTVSPSAAYARDPAAMPRASLITHMTSAAAYRRRGEDSSSPGVPETVTGRRVMAHNGIMVYSTPLHGASLPNMEAKTQRDCDSGKRTRARQLAAFCNALDCTTFVASKVEAKPSAIAGRRRSVNN